MERNNHYLFSVQRDYESANSILLKSQLQCVQLPLKSLLNMPVFKFKFIVIRCYKIDFFSYQELLPLKDCCSVPSHQKVLTCPPCYGLVAWPDVINSKYDEILSIGQLFVQNGHRESTIENFTAFATVFCNLAS